MSVSKKVTLMSDIKSRYTVPENNDPEGHDGRTHSFNLHGRRYTMYVWMSQACSLNGWYWTIKHVEKLLYCILRLKICRTWILNSKLKTSKRVEPEAGHEESNPNYDDEDGEQTSNISSRINSIRISILPVQSRKDRSTTDWYVWDREEDFS